MSLITLPNSFVNNTVADATEVNANFNVVVNEVNGSLNTANFAATLTFAAGDYIDLSAITHNTTALQGLRLPQIGTSPSSPTSGEGFMGWDETNNLLRVYSGSAWRTVLDVVLTSAAQGDILYHNGTNWVNLPFGTVNHVLTTNGTGANPAWEAGAQSTLTTQGDVLYRDGSGLARLAAGTSGYFLQTKGASQNPVWAAGGSWEFVESLATTSGTSVTSATLPTDSDLFMVVFEEVGGSMAASIGFTGIENAVSIQGTTVTNTASTEIAQVDAENVNGVIYVPRLAGGSIRTCPASLAWYTTGGVRSVTLLATDDTSAATITTMTFTIGAGAFDSGKIHIYKSIPS